MTKRTTQVLGGVVVPDTAIIDRAIDFARTHSDPFLFNHVVRSWLFAVRIGQLRDIAFDGEVVAIGTLLHDLGLTSSFPGPLRFEVEGANAAREFARDQGIDERRSQMIWDSVALNSMPSIGLYKETEVALCTAGIGLDFGGRQYDQITWNEINIIVNEFPRLEMKQRITNCFCTIVKWKPETTYDNFTRDFGERFVPGYKSRSIVDVLMESPFDQ